MTVIARHANIPPSSNTAIVIPKKFFIYFIKVNKYETWTPQIEDIRQLEAFEIWIQRRMIKVPWTEDKTNEEILQIVQTEREIMDTVRHR